MEKLMAEYREDIAMRRVKLFKLKESEDSDEV